MCFCGDCRLMFLGMDDQFLIFFEPGKERAGCTRDKIDQIELNISRNIDVL